LRLVLSDARLRGAAQLRQHQHGQVQVLRHQLKPARKSTHFLHAAFVLAVPAHQLQIVDDHQRQVLVPLQTPQFRMNIHEVGARCVVNINRRIHQLGRGGAQLPAFVRVKVTLAEFRIVHAGRGAKHAGEQRLLGHFKREDGHRLAQAGMRGDVLCYVQCQRRLAHGRPRGQDEQFTRIQAAGHLVQLEKTGAQSLDALARIEEGVDTILELVDDLCRRGKVVTGGRFAQLEEGVLGTGENLVGFVLARQAAVDHLLRVEYNPAEQRLVFDDARVAVEVRQLRQAVVERNQVA